MQKSPLANVVAHWSKLIEGLQLSPHEFYGAVEKAVERRQIPGLSTKAVLWSEGGVLSPDREYLRITGDRHHIDLCAAPFGSGFFFSSWLTERQPRFVFLSFIALVGLTSILSGMLDVVLAKAWSWAGPFGLFLANPIMMLGVVPLAMLLLTLSCVGLLARGGNPGPELAVLAMPIIGRIYGRLFAPETYYRLDTMSMFQAAVHSAMLEVIDGFMTRKGLRALSPSERKPIFRELLFSDAAPDMSPTSSRSPEREPPAIPQATLGRPLDTQASLV